MAQSFLKSYFGYIFLLPLFYFLILFSTGFLPFGSFRLTPMTDNNEGAPPPMGFIEKSEQTQDEKVSSLTQALPVGTQLSKKAKVSHVCEAVDTDKYIEPLRRSVHI